MLKDAVFPVACVPFQSHFSCNQCSMDVFGYWEQPASLTLTFSDSFSMVSDGWMDINISTYICHSID